MLYVWNILNNGKLREIDMSVDMMSFIDGLTVKCQLKSIFFNSKMLNIVENGTNFRTPHKLYVTVVQNRLMETNRYIKHHLKSIENGQQP